MDSQPDVLLEVKSMLSRLLEQAHEVESEVGEMPTADEALDWPLAEVEKRITARSCNTLRSEEVDTTGTFVSN